MKNGVVDLLLPGRYGRMSAAELDREVEVFDCESIAETARPLSAADQARLRRARRKGAADHTKKRGVVPR